MKEFFKSGKTAAMVLVLAVVLTVLVLGGVKLGAQRDAVDDLFYEGDLGNGMSIYSDLASRMDCAANLLTLSRRCGGEGAEETAALEQALAAMQEQYDRPQERKALCDADAALNEALENLYRAMENWSLSETDRNLAQKEYTAFHSAGDTIRHESYNIRAQEFNQLRSGFPTRLIAALTGVGDLETFN